MQRGAVLEIHVDDPETVRDLLIVLDRSDEKVAARMQRGEVTHIWIQKGFSGQAPTVIHFQGVNHG